MVISIVLDLYQNVNLKNNYKNKHKTLYKLKENTNFNDNKILINKAYTDMQVNCKLLLTLFGSFYVFSIGGKW